MNKGLLWGILIVLVVLAAVYALANKDKEEAPAAAPAVEDVATDENGVEVAPDASEEVTDEDTDASEEVDENDTTEADVEVESNTETRVDENGVEIAP